MNDTTSINILLADYDRDECLFFDEAIEELKLSVQPIMVNNGEQLMHHLEMVSANLPPEVFPDVNMPRKNGFKHLFEIKNPSTFRNLTAIFYAFYDEKKANMLYNTGAPYYICKPNKFVELKNFVNKVFIFVKQNSVQLSKQSFYINKQKAAL